MLKISPEYTLIKGWEITCMWRLLTAKLETELTLLLFFYQKDNKMLKLLIYMSIILTIISGSFVHGASEFQPDNNATISAINTVMEFYYTMHHGDSRKLHSMFIKNRHGPAGRSLIVFKRRFKIYDFIKIEISELNFLKNEQI